jgi:Mrp family chromosome partitioning ATPase
MDRPVLMVNCNPTNPLPEQVFSAADCLGIYDLLDEGVFRSEAIHGTGLANLKFIGRGKSTHRGAAFNSLLHFGLVLNELRSMFDVVIADLPYASPLTNCYDLAKSLDGVILEIESRRVRRLEATEIVDQLEFVSSPVLGCVFKQ